MQTKTFSLIESIANIVIGYFVSLAGQIVVFPLVGIHTTIQNNLFIGAAFTIISLVRSYALRRFFNGLKK